MNQHVVTQLKVLEVTGALWIEGADVNHPLLNQRLV